MKPQDRARNWLYIFFAILGFVIATGGALYDRASWPVSAGIGTMIAIIFSSIMAFVTGDIQRIGTWVNQRSKRTKAILIGFAGFIITLVSMLLLYKPFWPSIGISALVAIVVSQIADYMIKE